METRKEGRKVMVKERAKGGEEGRKGMGNDRATSEEDERGKRRNIEGKMK